MVSLTIGEKDYELRVTVRSAMKMEEQLKDNPINVFLKMRVDKEEDFRLPTLKETIILLHGALQPLNANISFNDAQDLYARYCKEGGSVAELWEKLAKAFEESGLIRIGAGEEEAKGF